MIRRAFHVTYTTARRIVVALVGSSVVLLGVIMLVTPGPALIVIPLGLAILAIEFVWARRWLQRLREMISERTARMRSEKVDKQR